jgi:hypothetical protein
MQLGPKKLQGGTLVIKSAVCHPSTSFKDTLIKSGMA